MKRYLKGSWEGSNIIIILIPKTRLGALISRKYESSDSEIDSLWR